jgi:tetratricopeptide (TPR) repeat protein
MKHKSTLAAIALLLWIAVPIQARSEDIVSCFGDGPMRQRIEACTAIIQDPNATDLDRVEAYGARGWYYSSLKRYQDGIDDLNRALAINPDSSFALNNRAWALYRWKNTIEGWSDVERALNLDPGNFAAWDTRAHLWQLKGEHGSAFKDYETAIGLGGSLFVRLYQCGLRERGLFKGEIDGIYSVETRTALKTCASSKSCDPLPDDSETLVENLNCGDKVS